MSWNKLGVALLNLGFCLSIPTLAPKAIGAEKIYVNYGLLEFSIPIEALEIYAREGRLTPELAAYTKFLNDQQLEQLSPALTTPAPLSAVALSQFLYSPQGEIILERVGQVVQTTARQSGFYALRSALILAAADGQLTALNVLQEFPTEAIRINTERGFEIFEDISLVIAQTGEAIAAVREESFDQALESSVLNFTDLPDLREPGTIPFSRQTLTLNDTRRNRRFPVDLYLPQVAQTNPLPVVVISHGLGSDRTTFIYLAQQLASHGFAVAVPEHLGSNTRQLQELLEGLASQVTPPQELIDRPLDIQFLLDRLEILYGGQLDVQNVGSNRSILRRLYGVSISGS